MFFLCLQEMVGRSGMRAKAVICCNDILEKMLVVVGKEFMNSFV